ncbi:hypothetical protein [Varibaculum vaginae]|uniref:hypothetical protein n=1 Tax=Varibaculum vaginae TaxID=2364797 RepID=UPI000F0788E5|nr:hypothetical protein [Varibaculum vaginae]
MSSNNKLPPISVIGGHQMGIDTAIIRASADALIQPEMSAARVKQTANDALTAALNLPRIPIVVELIQSLLTLRQVASDTCSHLVVLKQKLLGAADRYDNSEARSRKYISSLDSLPFFVLGGGLFGYLAWKEWDKKLAADPLQIKQSTWWNDNQLLALIGNVNEEYHGMFLAFPSAVLAWDIKYSRGPSRLKVAPKIGAKRTKLPVPLDAYGLVKQFNQAKAYPDHGEIRVVKYRTGEKIAWRVDIRGTQVWSVLGQNPQDMRTNLQTNASGLAGSSDMTKAVTRALDQAGYNRGQPVELIGHSQGGAVAAQIGANPYLVKKYNVKSVVTMGSNIGRFRPAPGVHMVALENTADVVPRLDGRANSNVPNLTTVQTYQDNQSLGSNHSKELYAQIAKAWQCSGDGDYYRFVEARNRNLGINATSTASAQSFVVKRIESPQPKSSKAFEKLLQSRSGS